MEIHPIEDTSKILPLKPEKVILTGRFVKLEPLDIDRDCEPLYLVSNGSKIEIGEKKVDEYDSNELIWKYMPIGPFRNLEEFRNYLEKIDSFDTLVFCIFDTVHNRQIGICGYIHNSPEDKRIELGRVWISPIFQRTNACLEMSYLLLKHAFGLGYIRLEWRCNDKNIRSKKSALKIGFRLDGTLENYLIIKNCNWDMTCFRILEFEWSNIREQLEFKLYG